MISNHDFSLKMMVYQLTDFNNAVLVVSAISLVVYFAWCRPKICAHEMIKPEHKTDCCNSCWKPTCIIHSSPCQHGTILNKSEWRSSNTPTRSMALEKIFKICCLFTSVHKVVWIRLVKKIWLSKCALLQLVKEIYFQNTQYSGLHNILVVFHYPGAWDDWGDYIWGSCMVIGNSQVLLYRYTLIKNLFLCKKIYMQKRNLASAIIFICCHY